MNEINYNKAYNKGTPVLSDAQFDELKKSLKESVRSHIIKEDQLMKSKYR